MIMIPYNVSKNKFMEYHDNPFEIAGTFDRSLNIYKGTVIVFGLCTIMVIINQFTSKSKSINYMLLLLIVYLLTFGLTNSAVFLSINDQMVDAV